MERKTKKKAGSKPVILEPTVDKIPDDFPIEEITEPEKIWWRNISGTFRMADGKIIKPNQKFQAAVEEIPQAFRDTIKPVDDVAFTKAQEEPVVISETAFSLKETDDGLYNIINAAGKQMNARPMELDIAEQTVEDLS